MEEIFTYKVFTQFGDKKKGPLEYLGTIQATEADCIKVANKAFKYKTLNHPVLEKVI